MKNTRGNFWGLGASMITLAMILAMFGVSCKKNSDDNIIFQGTYVGTLSMGFYSEPDTISITSGSSSSSVVMNSRTGAGSTFSLNGTVSGAKLSIPEQSVYDSNLNTTYTVSGSGTLSNNNNSLLINYIYVTSSSTTYYWDFSGTKLI